MLALKRSKSFSVIVTIVTVDHTGREASAVKQCSGFDNKCRIVLPTLPELRLFDRLRGERLLGRMLRTPMMGRRMMRTVRRSADTEGGANHEPP